MKDVQKTAERQNSFAFWLVVATAMHLLVLGSAFVVQWRDMLRKPSHKVVTVTLVSLPRSSGAVVPPSNIEAPIKPVEKPVPVPSPPKPVVTPVPPAPKVLPKPVVVPEKTLPTPAKEQPKRVEQLAQKPTVATPSASERQQQLNKVLEQLKQRVETRAQKSSPPQTPTASPLPSASNIDATLARLQEKVKAQSKPAKAANEQSTSAVQPATTVQAARTDVSDPAKGYGSGGASAAYKAQVKAIIQQNWAFSKTLLKSSEGMVVYVRIRILSDGTIAQTVFDKRAASEYLNNSVTKALEKSSPLPPLTKESNNRELWLGFMFSPSGVEK